MFTLSLSQVSYFGAFIVNVRCKRTYKLSTDCSTVNV